MRGPKTWPSGARPSRIRLLTRAPRTAPIRMLSVRLTTRAPRTSPRPPDLGLQDAHRDAHGAPGSSRARERVHLAALPVPGDTGLHIAFDSLCHAQIAARANRAFPWVRSGTSAKRGDGQWEARRTTAAETVTALSSSTAGAGRRGPEGSRFACAPADTTISHQARPVRSRRASATPPMRRTRQGPSRRPLRSRRQYRTRKRAKGAKAPFSRGPTPASRP
jgi:hypothetical protein